MSGIEKGRISAYQLLFSIICFIQGSTLLTSFFSSISKNDSWIVVVGGFTACLPILWILLKLISAFPDKNLVQINNEVFGPVLGAGVSALYMWFFLTLTALNLRDVGNFARITIMTETPLVVLIGLFIAVCAWAVYAGIQVVTRFGAAFVIVGLLIICISLIFTIDHMNMDNFLPMLRLEPIKYLHSINVIAMIPFGEVIVFMMFAPYVKEKKKLNRAFFMGFVIGGLSLLVVVFRDTAVLGNVMPLFALSPYETFRIVSITEAFNRIEMLFAIALIILMFFKIIILYYALMLGTAELFKLKSYRPLVLITGVFLTSYALFLYPTTYEHAASARETTPIIWLIFEMLLPLITLIVAKLRKMPKPAQVHKAL